ncbi:cyclic nucleotide-binding domain-containing protein [Luminiphilus syltensis]|nr:cyclic nucleotide-binding domain-containing protein [Luminiphilus syltensis]
MLATAQSGSDFQALNESAKAAVRDVFSRLSISGRELDMPPMGSGDYKALDGNCVAVVISGHVSVVQGHTVIGVFDGGDLLLPDTNVIGPGSAPLRYGSESGAHVRLYQRDQVESAIASEPATIEAWNRALILQITTILRLNALHIRETVGEGLTTELFSAGKIIIAQGAPADDVFSMIDGLAQVLVNDQPVAELRPGELFGTMAALMGSHRRATVRAIEDCKVVRLPKDHFFELIRSRPNAVHGLLVDMASSINELNEEVVRLREQLNHTTNA